MILSRSLIGCWMNRRMMDSGVYIRTRKKRSVCGVFDDE